MRRFLLNEKGNYSIIFAITLIPVMSAVASVTDLTSVTNKADQLQNALDTAALAVAGNYMPTMTDAEIDAITSGFLAANAGGLDRMTSGESASVTTVANSYQVTVRSGVVHEAFIGSFTWQTYRESIAQIVPGGGACVLALDGSVGQSIKIQGSAAVDMNGCILASNSNSDSALYRGGSAQLRGECALAVGGAVGLSPSSNVSLTCGEPKEHQFPSFDPLAAVEPPAYTACQNVPGGKTKTLSPGTYCGKTFSGDITLEPGTYILRGGKVNLGGNGALRGDGVTIFLMEGADFNINGNQIVDLSPPTTGDYAGITIFQDRASTVPVTVNGTSDSSFKGFVYAPGAHISYTGTGSTDGLGTCVRIVGNTVELNGNASFASSCDAELGGRKMYASRYISLIR